MSRDRSVNAKGKPADAARAVIEEDAHDAQAFVDRWRPRIDVMANARHAKMLRVVLGEVLEQKRFFEQALAGRTDLLGRRGAAPRARPAAKCCPIAVDRVAVPPIALGSNLGDRHAHLDSRRRLAPHPAAPALAVSSYYDTAPVGVVGPQPVYLNAAAVGETALSARELLEALLAIERERGRERPFPNAPRTLDLDLILFGEQ